MVNDLMRDRKHKVIVVAYPVGRIGSSAMMGLLNIAGVNVGKQENLSKAAPMNPRGFYELRSQQQFLTAMYPGIYPQVSEPPPLNMLDAVSDQGYQEYGKLLQKEFDGQFPIAVKSQRFLTIPFLDRLSSIYDVKILVMSRNDQDMVRSIKRVWARSENPVQTNATDEFILKWLHAWIQFGKDVRARYPLEYLDVDFDELLVHQVENMNRIALFCKIQCPSEQKIRGWLDIRLVNRSSLQ